MVKLESIGQLVFTTSLQSLRSTRSLAVTFRKTDSQLVPLCGGRGGEEWSHRLEDEGERSGPTVWRKRERGRGVVPPCGGGGRRGEEWSHRVEEEGGEVVQHL